MEKISIIICSYNEEKTICEVVKACCQNNSESEIIVVDDGSTDNTEVLLRQLYKEYNFSYIRLLENKGKSYAMVVGVENACNEIILFIDADISNLKQDHFQKILKPIIENEADMVLGQPEETLINYHINPFKSLTGQRALLKKDILPILNEIKVTRFGVETYINLYYQAHGKKVEYVMLDGLSHPTKFEKTTPLKATKEFILEGNEIALTLLKNNDLITRRIEYSFNKTNSSAKTRLQKIQSDINKKLQYLLDKFNM